MLAKNLLIISGLMASFNLTAQNIIDLYGTSPKKSEEIIKKYAREVEEVENSLLAVFKQKNQALQEKEFKQLAFKKNRLTEKIKKEGDFLFVNFSTIFYPDKKNQYITIEVIDKKQAHRLRFTHAKTDKPSLHNSSSTHAASSAFRADLINQMNNFNEIAMQLIINNEPGVQTVSCPVYHCISNFNHPKLKPYLKLFNMGAIKEKQLILDTLNKDPDPKRRAAAAFLMGHFSNPKEIITRLSPHVNDNDPDVRNNVMRVMAMTLEKSRITQIDPMPFIDLLDSPEATDRNKALYVLLKAAESDTIKSRITKEAGSKLIALLQLKQPNNHEMAYMILEKISGEKYEENNISAWQNWLKRTNNIT